MCSLHGKDFALRNLIDHTSPYPVSTGAKIHSSGVKWPEHEVDRSLRTSAKIHSTVCFYRVVSRHAGRRYGSYVNPDFSKDTNNMINLYRYMTGCY